MPTTTNLSITYPASSDYVTNGATAMGTIATGIDAFFGALTTYTPTTGNITGATATGYYVRLGKLGFVRIRVSAGTATAASYCTVSLPSGWTGFSTHNQPLNAWTDGTGTPRLRTAVLYDGTDTVRYWQYFDGLNMVTFGAGASCTVVMQGWLELD